MTLLPVSCGKIYLNDKLGDRHRVEHAIIAFMESNMRVARVVCNPGEYANFSSMRGSFKSALKRMNTSCKYTTRRGQLYLYKEDENG